MELLSVRCNHCGAPLEVGAQTRFVTCQFCHSQLEVKRTDHAAFTEVVADLAAKTDAMAGNLKVIELQNELERVDREWELEREGYYVTRRNGRRTPPTLVPVVASGFIGGAILIGWIIVADRMGAPPIFPIFGFLALLGLGFNIAHAVNRSGALDAAEKKHRARRAEILGKIEAARKPAAQ